MFFVARLIEPPDLLASAVLVGRCLVVAPAVEGIDLIKIAGRSISGWVKSFKTGMPVNPNI